MLHRYYNLNYYKEDFLKMVQLFYIRLSKRNYNKKFLKRTFIKSIESITKKTSIKQTTINHSKPLILKTTFNNSIDKNYLRLLLHKHFIKDNILHELNFNREIISFKRQENLKELLFPSHLQIPSSLDIPSIRKSTYNLTANQLKEDSLKKKNSKQKPP